MRAIPHSHAVTEKLKQGSGSAAELFDRLKGESAFANVDFASFADPAKFVGRAPEQVDDFIAQEIEPIRRRYAGLLDQKADLDV